MAGTGVGVGKGVGVTVGVGVMVGVGTGVGVAVSRRSKVKPPPGLQELSSRPRQAAMIRLRNFIGDIITRTEKGILAY
jgi:hypothetical protein